MITSLESCVRGRTIFSLCVCVCVCVINSSQVLLCAEICSRVANHLPGDAPESTCEGGACERPWRAGFVAGQYSHSATRYSLTISGKLPTSCLNSRTAVLLKKLWMQFLMKTFIPMYHNTEKVWQCDCCPCVLMSQTPP